MGDYIADTDWVDEEDKEDIEHDELKQRSSWILGERLERISELETEAQMRFSGRSLPKAESEDDAEEKVRPLQRPQSMAVVPTPVSLAGETSLQEMV